MSFGRQCLTVILTGEAMSDYPSMPAPPPSEWQGQPAAIEPPQEIKTAVNIVWAIVAVSVLATILTFLYLDDFVEAAGADLTSAEQDAARSGAIVGAIIGFLVFGALWVVLGIFLRKGANWARIVLTVLAGLGILFGIIPLLAGNQPAVLMIVSIVQLVLLVALLYFMWRKESTAYITARKSH
jgi:uncharacterized membrane protein